MPSSPGNITQLLLEWDNGSQGALEQLMPLVYGELHRLAAAYFRRQRPGHTLQPTALVNELYMRLAGEKGIRWQNRAHFYGMAARMMREILIDYARKQNAAKRGGAARQLSLSIADRSSRGRDIDLVALDDALNDLARIDPKQSRIVELRFFGGLNIEETAHVLELSPATVKREWRTARAWLFQEVSNRLQT
jgi:RNA polymerase sigma factor (TIGR02999 family)